MMKDTIIHTEKGTYVHEKARQIVPLKRTGSPLEADSHSAPGGLENSLKKVSLLHRPTKLTSPTHEVNFPGTCTYLSRITLLLLLLLTLGINVSWGQDTDYSGTYYIASGAKSADNGSAYTYNPDEPDNNFYLCPTKGWINYLNTSPYYTTNSNSQPFLTTFNCRSGELDPTTNNPYDEREAKWTLIKNPSGDGYYIRRNIDGYYLTLNGQLGDGAGTNRLRLHIEAPNSLGENHLFAVESNSTNLAISSIKKISNKTWYLNVHQGNFPALTGVKAKDKNQGPTGYENIGGIIGIYDNKDDQNAPWYLEDVILPVIEQQNDNTITITCPGCSIYYTTDNTPPDPNNSGEGKSTQLYDVPFEMTQPVTTVKAVAVRTKDTDETLDTYSRVVSLTTQFYIGSEHPYLLQSKECQFYYMIPSVSNTLNTLNVPCKEMAWYLESAGTINGTQYYYIHNAQGGGYVYNNNDNLALNATNGETDTYMFRIAGSAENGYSLTSKNRNKQVYKASINTNAVSLKTDATSQALWNIISYTGRSSLPQWKTTPFTESTNDSKYYYQIKSSNPIKNGEDDVFIVLNSSDAIKCEVLPEEQKKALWVIKKVGYDTDNLLDYYTLQNVYTGELLYYTGVGQGITNNAALQMGQPSGGNETWSHFVIVQTLSTTEGVVNYNIIPRAIVDNVKSNGTSKHAYNCLNRSNGGDAIGTWYDDGNSSRWTFVEQTDVPCVNPIFTETDPGTGKVITLTLPTPDSATDIYFTDDGTDPTDDGATPTKYSDQSWPSSTQKLIKAFAKLKNDNMGGSISSVVTLFNNPKVTLSQDTYTYNGTAQAPAIGEMEVSITINSEKITAPSGTYEIDESVNNTNVGSPSSENPPTVKLKDVAGDNWYVWNASKTFTIDPLTATLIWTDTSIPYNKTQQKPTATVGNLVTGDECTVTVTVPEGDGITVDEYTATATALSNANYALPAVTTQTFNIVQKDITISGITAENKVYDKTTTATLGYTSVTYDGIVEGDDLTITATGAFEDANAGTGKTVNISGLTLGGTSIANYKLAETGQQATATADITKKDVTVSGITAENKVYDGTATATFDCSTAVVTGLLEGDDLEVTSATGTFNDKNVGEGKTVTITGFTMGGTSGDNYKAADTGNQTSSTANITQLEAELAWSNDALTYNATAQAPMATISNAAEGDNIIVTVTGAETNAREDYMATASLAGTDAGNYSLPPALSTHNFTIAPKVVGLSWSNLSFTYDGSSHIPTLALTGIIDPDECEVTVTGAQTDASATAYTATASNLTNSNYALPDPATQEFTIGPKSLGTGTNTPAEGITFTIAKENDNYVITVNHEGIETPLTAGSDKDYTISTEGTTSKYYIATINGVNNYTGSISIKYACVNFTTDDSGLEWAATFVAENATNPTPNPSIGHALPDGVKAYIITSIEGDNANTVELNYIPEGVPVVLISNKASGGFVVEDASGHTPIMTTGENNQKDANMLEEVTTDPHQHFTVATIYLLYKNEFVLNKEGDLAKGKVYLNPNHGAGGGGSGGGEGARLKIVKGGGTGIENIEYTIDSQSGAWYTLDGRRLSSKPTKKGLYLQNGKKIVVK